MAAPSAVAKDPWRLVVVKRRELLKKIADHLPHGKMIAKAPVGLIVCGSIDEAHDNELSYMLQDCSAAIENILLAASKLGLGAVWLGVHPRAVRIAHMRKVFALPESIIPVSVLSLGWPGQTPSPRTRYNEKAVHWEQW